MDKKDLRLTDVNQIWRTLGIRDKVRETTAGGARDTDKTFNCSQDDRCEAQLVDRPDWPLLAGGDGDVVVRIAPAYLDSNLRRFLVFHRDVASWRLVDYLDLTEWDYDQPQTSVIASAGKRWLVVTAWPHCGTGCSERRTSWYELKNGKLRLVLTVPASGHQGNENPGRQFETRFVRASQSDGRETLEFLYHVGFFPGFGSTIKSDLWGDEKIIQFSRPSGQGEFKFDAKYSEASEAFVKNMFSSLEAGPQLFELIRDHLLKIARGPNDSDREWLKELLEQNSDVPQLARVRAAMEKSP